MTKTKSIYLGLLAILLSPMAANAVPITVGAFSGGENVEDLEGLGSAPPVGSFTYGDFSFSESSSGTGGPGWRWLDGFFVAGSHALTDNAGISDIIIDALSPWSRIGLDVGIGDAVYAVSFYDTALSLLGTVSGSASGVTGNFFAGWEFAGGISRIRIIETSGENGRVGGIDNIRYENVRVSEPGTLALLGLGLAGMGMTRRKKKV